MRSYVSILLVSALGSACGVSPVELSKNILESQCYFTSECCAAAEIDAARDLGFPSNPLGMDKCVEARSESFSNWEFIALQEAVDAGRIRWDGARAAECYQPLIDSAYNCKVNEFLSNEYSLSSGEKEGCEIVDFIEGLVEDGEPCYRSLECATAGAYCERDERDDDAEELVITAVGSCVPPLAKGADCTGDGRCAPGSFCDGSVCTAYIAAGESCGTGVCEPGTDCLNGVCRAPLEVGDACENDWQCASGACEYVADLAGTCVAVGETQPEVIYEICTGEPLGS